MKGIDELLSRRSELDAELRKHKSPATVMLTGLAGSGDTVGVPSTEQHNTVLSALIQQHSGVLVKTIRDSLIAYFTDPARAVACAVDIQKAIQASNVGRADAEQEHARAALHHGLAYLRGADVFGDVVNVAARIAKACLPAQILVSEALYVSAQSAVALPFKPVGSVHFEGKSGLEKLYEVIWTDEDSYQKLRDLFPCKQQQQTEDDVSGGRYIIMSELGRGAMGMVYKAYDRHIGRMVAMKTIPLEVDEKDKQELVARLKQESRAAGILDHPNIVTVYDVGEEAGVFYFTMQYVEGRTLACIRAEKKLLPLEQVLDIMEQVLSAIGFAHQRGIIHRDIKPSNLMLTPQGTTKVMDFGIAKFSDTSFTQAGIVVGTPSYLAPEQAAGRRIDTRADIFALGSVFYELLTAEKAFPGESTTSIVFKILNEEPVPPRVIEPSLAPALEAIVRKALAKDPNQRFQSCEEMRTAIREYRKNPRRSAANATAQSTPIPVAARTMTQPPKSSKTTWMILGFAVLVMAAAIAFTFIRTNDMTWPGVVAAATEPPPAPPAPRAIAAPPIHTDASVADPPNTAEESATNPREIEETAAKEDVPATVEDRNKEKAQTAKRPPGTPKGDEPSSRQNGSLRRPRATASSRADSSLAGFDTPTLLRIADNYAGKGEYRKAVYIYKQVLLRDPRNLAAKEGLRRAQGAQAIDR